jgi:G3E family GTPase
LKTAFTPRSQRQFQMASTAHSAVTSHSIVFEGNLYFPKFDYWLSKTLYDKGHDLYRMKGILSLERAPQKFIFQSVHDQFTHDLGEVWKPGERSNSIVMIGKNLDFKALEEELKACIYLPEKV